MTQDFWLNFLGGTEQVVIFYNSKGRPVNALNKENHYHLDFLKMLLRNPAGALFNLPDTIDLNDLFPPEKTGSKPFPTRIFASKNVTEASILYPFWVVDFSLSSLTLIKMSENQFAGVVRFDGMVKELTAWEHHPTLMINSENQIIGYNSSVISLAGLKTPEALLGRRLGELLDVQWGPRAFLDKSDWPAKPSIDWDFSKSPLPFEAHEKANVSFRTGKQGLLWKNESVDSHGLVQLNIPIPMQDCDLFFEMAFESEAGVIPSLILGGRIDNEGNPSDSAGYMLTTPHFDEPENRELVFKQGGLFARHYPLPVATTRGTQTLTVERQGFDYRFSFNGKPLGTWHCTTPVLFGQESLAFLFLRPGKQCLFKKLLLKTKSQTTETAREAPVTAKIVGRSDIEFKVSIKEGVIRKRNYTLLNLEDVTFYRKSIDTLTEEKQKLKRFLKPRGEFIGNSPAVKAIKQEISQVASSGLAVLLEGETGTGKEVLAQYLHNLSDRQQGPFVKIDCSTIPEALMESELFGHEKGSFTGATGSHQGRFEQAHKGTIFLDEIANLTLTVQAKLLSVLQDFKIQRVGGQKPIAVNVRVVAASNIPLTTLVKEKKFRQDLYYRINQYRFELPPLRARREDIPLLVEAFIKEANQTYHKKVKGMDPGSLEIIYQSSLAGNVRELRNIIFRALLFCQGDTITPDLIKLESESSDPIPGISPSGSKRKWGGSRTKFRVTRESFENTLKKVGGNLTKLSESLGISRGMAYKKAKELGLDLNRFRE